MFFFLKHGVHKPARSNGPLSTGSGVARICCEEGQRLKLCHGALKVDFRAGCSSCWITNSFVTLAELMERAVSCWHLHQLISQTTQYFASWLSDLEAEARGARAPVPQAGDATVDWYSGPQWAGSTKCRNSAIEGCLTYRAVYTDRLQW